MKSLPSRQLMKLVLDALSYHWTFRFTSSDITQHRLEQYDGLHHVTPYKSDPLSAATRRHSAKMKNGSILDS